MRLTRVFIEAPLTPDASVELPPGPAQHLTRVLRLAAGAPLTVFNGRGGEYEATIESIRRDLVTVRVGAHLPIERESPLTTTLLQGIARGEKMDLILQKATELGVSRVVPVATLRGSVKLGAETAARKQAHWRGVVIGACEQSGRTRVPEVVPPMSLANSLAVAPDALKLVLAPDEGAESLQSLLAAVTPDTARSICMLVGPEGGLDAEEIRQAQAAGFHPCRLGPRVLRTETAALVTLAALQFARGDFK